MALLSNVVALSVATSLTNLDSSRHRATDASLECRKQGWTERWGTSSASDEKTPTQSTTSPAGGKEEALGPGTPSEQLTALTQHRVAWLEQLVLRVASVPHSVANSSYSVSEATGPLPYITGCDPATGRPCLVGRLNPSCRSTASPALISPPEDGKSDGSVPAAAVLSGSDILQYLRIVHKVDLDCHAVDGEGGDKHLVSRLDRQQTCESLAISSLIQQTLDPILTALRYCDERSYSQTYLPAARRASLNPNGEVGVAGDRCRRAAPPFFGAVHFFPSFQPYAEKLRAVSELAHFRCSGRSLLSPGRGRDHQVDVHAALTTADEHYQALDDRLQQMAKLEDGEAAKGDAPTAAYLLGTNSPTNVDALLFAHLADALADPHMLTLLPQYKHLVRFFRTVYEAYFGPDYRFDYSSEDDSSPSFSSLTREELDELVAVNNRANDVNAYNAMGLARALSSSAALIDAIGTTLTKEDIMEAARLEKDTAGGSLRRLLLGGGLYPVDESDAMSNATFFRRNKNGDSEEGSKEGKNGGTPSAEAKMEKIKMDRKEGDTVWVVSIIAGVALVLAMSRKA